ncbi:MAG: serine/threonine protein kinase [Gemmataceae bacterium]|nr:serine/threonine protein kinase [Gemmataceae bacterium]
MPAPATVAELLDLVQKSGVADEARLKAYMARLAELGTVPTEPAKFAGLLVRDGMLTYFQAEQLLQGKYKRFSLGKYKVLEKIGSGGMGTVFLCEHKLMRRRVAIKVLPTAKAADEASLGRFYREARAVAAVDHPNIVRAYDIDQDENLHFLVMEYVDGTNLQDLVKKVGPLDVVRACHYIYASAVGLQHAHEIGLVHRDIKPGNILIDRSGVVKILDMGLARFFHDTEDHLTRKYDETILGTADYLSPEQAEDSHTVDIRTDIYSLGATFYYLLTGTQPFPDGTIPQKLIWHRSRDPKPIAATRPDVPDEVAAIVQKMMAKKSGDRYQTPSEVMAALAPWASTPIPPPTERELPQLSPAATAGGGGTGRTMVSQAQRSMVAPIPHLGGPGGSGGRLAPPVGQPGTVTVEDGGPAHTPSAGTPSVPGEDDSSGGGVWESLDDTAEPMADTGLRSRTPAPKPKSSTAHAPTRPKRRFSPLVLIAAGVLLAGAAVGAYFLFSNKKPATDTSPQAGGSKRLTVSKALQGAENTFPTLAAALRAVKEGDTIVLAESPLAEPSLRLDRRVKDLTIESGLPGGKPAVIEFASGTTGSVAMLDLSSTEGIHLKDLELDGKGVADFGVQASGVVSGVTFENVTVRNVKTAAFRLQNVAGEPARPVTLDRVRVFLAQSNDAGVVVVATGTLESKYVVVRNSRFDGAGKGIGVKIDGAVVGAEVTGNRFYKLDAAVLLGRVAENRSFKMQLTQNTVYESKVGIQFGPAAGGAGRLEVAINRNYFAKTPAIAQADAEVVGPTSADNGQRESGQGNVPVNAAPLENPQLPPPNPDDDATFLRFPAGPMPMVGSNRVGAN